MRQFCNAEHRKKVYHHATADFLHQMAVTFCNIHDMAGSSRGLSEATVWVSGALPMLLLSPLINNGTHVYASLRFMGAVCVRRPCTS